MSPKWPKSQGSMDTQEGGQDMKRNTTYANPCFNLCTHAPENPDKSCRNFEASTYAGNRKCMPGHHRCIRYEAEAFLRNSPHSGAHEADQGSAVEGSPVYGHRDGRSTKGPRVYGVIRGPMAQPLRAVKTLSSFLYVVLE